jgi:murein DD-endopeptidase MepM/ murein hydrolase activator NlpD
VIFRKQNFIFQSASDASVKQWHFTPQKIILILAGVLVAAVFVLYFVAGAFVKIAYRTELKDVAQDYSGIVLSVDELEEKLDQLNDQIGWIEKKDQAVRSYADMPQIDNDIRKLGIGGLSVNDYNRFYGLAPDVEKRVSLLEMDIEALSRKVKLELESYTSIYEKVKQNSKKIEHIPSILPSTGGYLNTGFTFRFDPFDGKRRFHYGQDIVVNTGTPVFAPAAGRVQQARYKGGFGKTIKINHGYGYVTFFAHLSRYAVKRGTEVKRGDLIGYSGNSGRSTGPHLHYEVHYYGKPQNPLDYFFSGYLK